MKAEDLMIGDWVLIPDHQDASATIPVRVSMVNDCNALTIFCNGGDIIFNGNEIKFIPLTSELLEKNGILYEKSSFYYIIKDDKDLGCSYYIYQTIQEDWAIGVDTGAYNCSVFARIKYIHELQHALKLCGIDKEIMV